MSAARSGPLASVADSLEARWFMPGPLPPEAAAWFESLGPSVTPEARTDRYLVPVRSEELGLKVREGAVQAKQRTAALGLRPLAPGAVGRVEAWRKWTLGTSEQTPEAGWIDVAKVRRQRTLVLVPGAARCALEVSEIEAGGEAWWSVCLEASGARGGGRWRALRAAARRWLGSGPALAAEASEGYPAWLLRVAR